MEDIHDIKYFSLKKVQKFLKENDKNPKVASELTKLILSNDPQTSMRASWTLQHLCFKKPELIYPQIPKLIRFLQMENQHTGAMRNVIRVFMELDLPEKYCGPIFDLCLQFSKNTTLPHAVRVFSIYTLANICLKYPELKPELDLILSELKMFPQPGSIVACIKKTSKILLKA